MDAKKKKRIGNFLITFHLKLFYFIFCIYFD